MNLEFYDFEFSGIGRTASKGKAMWGQLELGLRNTDDNLISRVEIKLFLSKNPAITLAELQTEARDRAMKILRAALACLEESDIPTLEQKETPEF